MVAARSMLMQHQLALDLLLASEGGLCHVIGSECCSYVPDTADNLTMTLTHMNDLLSQMKAEDVNAPAGFAFWDWVTSGSWFHLVLQYLVPVVICIVVFAVFACCIMPL
uniref:Uncharacterized protein n=1 Tax=Nothobranchius kadleci TaxID=1051664 RepID=A0A1A8BZF0_NOTKA